MTDQRPTLYLSNFASYRTVGHHGPGRTFTIMAKPRKWEHGEGSVRALVPSLEDLENFQLSLINGATYRKRFIEDVEARDVRPGSLLAWLHTSGHDGNPIVVVVRDGDTLCCACSRSTAKGEMCHRAWAAPILAKAGWNVVLDGETLKGDDCEKPRR